MKSKPKKIIVFSILFVAIIISFGVYIGNISEANTPKAEALMLEELPNGQTKVVDSIPTKKETLEWLVKKQSELVVSIAEQTKLEAKDVLVVLGPMPNSQEAGSNHIACSVVLKTESTFEDKIMNKVLEDIVGTITQDSIDAKISEEHITIVNSNGVKLN